VSPPPSPASKSSRTTEQLVDDAAERVPSEDHSREQVGDNLGEADLLRHPADELGDREEKEDLEEDDVVAGGQQVHAASPMAEASLSPFALP
jgi:hypothetical protein